MPTSTPPKTHAALMRPIVKEVMSGLVGARHFLNSVILSAGAVLSWSICSRQITLKKAECVWYLDYAHANGVLLLQDLIAKGLHSRPMDFRPEMMFGVVTIIEPDPVIELVITTHPPRNRLVGIAAVMPIVPVQIRQAVPKVPKRQKKTEVTPVENAEDNKRCDERGQLKDTPKRFTRIFALQFLKNRLRVFAKEAEEGVLEGMLRFAVVTMFVDRNPIDSFTRFIWAVCVAFAMLHVNAFVEDLAKADCD